jgi:hypothetical protein
MSRTEQWEALVAAITAESEFVQNLVRLTVEMARPLSRLDIPGLERTTADQEAVLMKLEEAAGDRSDAMDRCLPGSGGASGRLAFQMVIASAPEPFATSLRDLRDRLLLLRDEFTLVRARNQMIMEQTLEFTGHFGRSLAEDSAEPPSYDARGARAPRLVRGELFSGAL